MESLSSARPTTSRSRPRATGPTRAIARTQQSERVRASVNRHRITQARTAQVWHEACCFLLASLFSLTPLLTTSVSIPYSVVPICSIDMNAVSKDCLLSSMIMYIQNEK